jgi:hypothetical protein
MALKHAEGARKELLERFSKPIPVTDAMRANLLYRVKRAAAEGKWELKVLQFPLELCTDGGRAINNNEPDWPEILTGVPRQAYEVWRDRLKPAEYLARGCWLLSELGRNAHLLSRWRSAGSSIFPQSYRPVAPYREGSDHILEITSLRS